MSSFGADIFLFLVKTLARMAVDLQWNVGLVGHGGAQCAGRQPRSVLDHEMQSVGRASLMLVLLLLLLLLLLLVGRCCARRLSTC